MCSVCNVLIQRSLRGGRIMSQQQQLEYIMVIARRIRDGE